MRCPHCSVGIHEGFVAAVIANEPQIQKAGYIVPGVYWTALHLRCPECNNSIIYLQRNTSGKSEKFLGFPPGPLPYRTAPAEVPDAYRRDFVEACVVLPYSAKASAALSRRCLQAILREKARTTKKDLFDQIEEVVATGTLPSHISEDLHAVRSIGNIAAHSMKSTKTGEIVDVEPGEAEWNLDVLESLFDFYFVQPALSAKRKADLNKKLKEAGKSEI